jgi:hypothetical protein
MNIKELFKKQEILQHLDNKNNNYINPIESYKSFEQNPQFKRNRSFRSYEVEKRKIFNK